MLCNSGQREEREAQHLKLLQQQRVQGLLVTPVDPESPLLDEIRRRGTPVVIVDRTRHDSTFCSVAVDDLLGGRLAVEHLVDRGHERVAFVGGPMALGQVRDRLEGARAAWAAAGRPSEDLTVITTASLDVASGREAGDRLAGLPSARRPTAAFCANDLTALGLLQHAIGSGTQVPERAGDRRLRRHRVRGRSRRTPLLGAPAPPASSGARPPSSPSTRRRTPRTTTGRSCSPRSWWHASRRADGIPAITSRPVPASARRS